MTEDAKSLLARALTLPEDERELLAIELFHSLPEHTAEEEAAYAREIQRRVEEVESGQVKGIPWSVAKDMIRSAADDDDPDSSSGSG